MTYICGIQIQSPLSANVLEPGGYMSLIGPGLDTTLDISVTFHLWAPMLNIADILMFNFESNEPIKS